MSTADLRVFGPFYIPRSRMLGISDHVCTGCGRAARSGEWWGVIDNRSHCGACCDAEEARQQ